MINKITRQDYPEIWDSEYGCDDVVNELYRVEKKKKIIETEEWNIVK
jgi:hypothetical protein